MVRGVDINAIPHREDYSPETQVVRIPGIFDPDGKWDGERE